MGFWTRVRLPPGPARRASGVYREPLYRRDMDVRDLKFEIPRPIDADRLQPFYSLRPNKTCDSGMLDTYIWQDYYNIKCCIVDDKALLMHMRGGEEHFSCIPYCAEADLPYYFDLLKRYFNEVLQKPLKIYLADEEGVELLKLKEDPNFIVCEEEDLKDYLYDAEELRTLPGKKFQKKRNLVNKFMREMKGRFEYRPIACDQKHEVKTFLKEWFSRQKEMQTDSLTELESEALGLNSILENCTAIAYCAGGIYIDGKLSALSVGAYNPKEDMACICVEKAFGEIPGIYQAINQLFLQNAFPEVKLVNREDDMGKPGLRQAKESYQPIGYARKYMVLQKDFEGYKEELYDYYEDEIAKNNAQSAETDPPVKVVDA